MIDLNLLGCKPQPLAAFLKGLGVLRLVSQQVDPAARASWQDSLVLSSELNREHLIDFFLTKYQPTPVLAPWNGGSGFYPKDRKVGIQAIAKTQTVRFEPYRKAILIASSIVGRSGVSKGASKLDEDERRTTILRLCRNELPDDSVDWLDAAVAISSENKRAFAPILGTGGNEGRLDYTNNFMENVSKLLISPDKKIPVRELLEQALFDIPSRGFQDIAVGQYEPGRTGGFNQGQGIESGVVANPWTAILTIEGAIAWAGGIYRKQGMSYRSFLCSPFTVRPTDVGYASSAEKDGLTARAEIWVPIWSEPATYGEVKSLLREGRAQVAGRPARTGLEFAQAVASLGVDREISHFVRYALFKRRGDSYVATPLGEFPVRYQGDSDLIREVTPLLQAAGRSIGEQPASWKRLRRKVEEAQFNALLKGGPKLVRDVAVAVGQVQEWLLQHEKSAAPTLNLKWILRCADASPAETRIAAALAFLCARSVPGKFGSYRIHANLRRKAKEFAWQGRDLPDRMLATLRRRAMDSSELKVNPFQSDCYASINDVTQFISGSLDDDLIESLFFAFTLVKAGATVWRSNRPIPPWPVYCLLKHLFLTGPIKDTEILPSPDLAVASLLAAGKITEAAKIARRRLMIGGMNPIRADFAAGQLDPRRLGAALLIPVRNSSILHSVLNPATEPSKGQNS